MFVAVKNETGAAIPWESRPAKAGAYQTGQLLEVSGGMLAPMAADCATVPEFLCMQTGTVAADGDGLSVQRVSRDAVYETELSAAAASLAFGTKMSVAAGGLTVKTGSGAFVVQDFDGTAKGDRVRGRWGEAPAAASGSSSGSSSGGSSGTA